MKIQKFSHSTFATKQFLPLCFSTWQYPDSANPIVIDLPTGSLDISDGTDYSDLYQLVHATDVVINFPPQDIDHTFLIEWRIQRPGTSGKKLSGV